MILGNYEDSTLAAMNIAGPTLWCAFSLFGAFGAGVLAVVGRAYGAQQESQVRQTVGTALCIAAVIGLIVGWIGYSARWEIAGTLAGGSDTSLQTLERAALYMGLVFLSTPAQMLGGTATVSLQSQGDTRTPMYSAVAAGITNLAVTYVFVFGEFGAPSLGIEGAAYGTMASFGVNALLLNLKLVAHRSGYGVGRPTWLASKRIYKITVPAFGEKLLFHTGYLIFVGIIGHLGDVAMVAHQALIAIESLGFIGSSAFGIAAGAIVAQKLGADRPDQAEEGAHLSAKLGLIALTSTGIIFFLFAETLVGLFTDNPQALSEGVLCLRIAAIAQPLMAIADVYAGALRGAGDTKTPMMAALMGPLLVRIVLCWFLAYGLELGLVGIWIGSTADWLVRSLWLFGVFRAGRWKTISV